MRVVPGLGLLAATPALATTDKGRGRWWPSAAAARLWNVRASAPDSRGAFRHADGGRDLAGPRPA